METLIFLLFDIALLITYSLVGFMIAMLIQGIVYWTTGFSIMRFLYKKFILDELKK